MPKTMTFTGTLIIVRCWCGIQHGVPKDLHDYQLRQKSNGVCDRDLQSVWCPLGHEHVPAGTTQAQDEAEAQQRRAENAERAAEIQRTRAERAERDARRVTRSNAALRGHLTRMRTRMAAGICPVPGCRRSGFSKVRAHLASKHPEWMAEHAHELDEA